MGWPTIGDRRDAYLSRLPANGCVTLGRGIRSCPSRGDGNEAGKAGVMHSARGSAAAGGTAERPAGKEYPDDRAKRIAGGRR
jgi:hypothetical protein